MSLMPVRVFPFALLAAAGVAQFQIRAGGPGGDRTVVAPPGPSAATPTATQVTAGDWSGVVVDQPTADTVLAATPHWKVAFDRDGAVFVPFLGADAPRSWPVAVGRARVAVGGEDLPAGTDAPRRDADGVAFAAPWHEERWELRAEGIEQRFVFAALPARGAIAITMPVATELAVGAEDGGFRFANARGSCRYGRAEAIDAAGRRLPLEAVWTGAAIELRVPAAFVRDAVLPLVVDPLLGNVVQVGTDTRAMADTDLAWDEGMHRFALIHERVFSATDSDIYLQYVDANMQPVGALQPVDLTTTSWRRPRIAGLRAATRFLVVAEVSTGNAAPFRVGGRIVDGLGGTMLAPFDVTTPSANNLAPDVGGDPTTVTGGHFLVAWEHEITAVDHDIFCRLVAADGTLSPSIACDAALTYESRPSVSRSCGDPAGGEAWAVGLLRGAPGAVLEARVNFVARSGVPLSLANSLPVAGGLAADATFAVSSPTDQALGRHYAFVTLEASGNQEVELTYLLDQNGQQVMPWQQSVVTAPPVPGSRPILETDGCRFALLTHLAGTAAGTSSVYVSLFAPVHGHLATEDFAYIAGDHASSGGLAARHAGGAADSHYGIAWIEPSGAGTRVQAADFGGWQPGTALVVRPTGCGGTSLSVTYRDSFALGTSFHVDNPANSGFFGIVAGLPVNVPLPFCPSCTQGVDGTASFGSTLFVTIPRQPELVGATAAFQSFQFVLPGSGSCLGQLNLGPTCDITVR